MAEDAEGKGHLWNLWKPMCEGTLNPAAVSLLQKLAQRAVTTSEAMTGTQSDVSVLWGCILARSDSRQQIRTLLQACSPPPQLPPKRALSWSC